MDTKLKSIKYSTGAKVAAFVVVWLCVMSAVGSAVFLLYHQDIVENKSYYDTYEFKSEFGKQIYDVVEFYVKLKSEANIRSSGEAEDIIRNNLSRYYGIKKTLPEKINFVYYLHNNQTGETFTNVESEDPVVFIKKQSAVAYYNQWSSDHDNPVYGDIKELLTGTAYEVYAAVDTPLKPGDVFYDGFNEFIKIKTRTSYVMALLAASVILAVAALAYLLVVTGRREGTGEIVLSSIDKIYTDVHSMLVFIAAVISVAIAGTLSLSINNPVAIFIIALVFGIDVIIGLSYVLSMVRQLKKGQLLTNTLVYKIYEQCFNGKPFKTSALLLLLGYGVVNGVLFAMTAGSAGGFFIFVFFVIPFNIAAVYFAARSLSSLSQIMDAAKEISAGNLEYTLDNSKISAIFSSFARDIQSIQGGLKKAVAEAVKGERMKTDLIANVSHDLKTPLTSIINYVDLLKQEDLNNEKANQYISVLEEKSARLKQLIEDLIEASKASSGNIAVCTEKVDLHELVMQGCGEYEEKLNKAELDVHISADDKVLIAADGKHMWRIVENLLSNVVKYSLPRTRVYINVAKNDGCGVLIIKNISAAPLDIPPEQLTERFVRGDESRTTEGSGLGLSIAQGLTSIQGGRFNIEIDGDLFKVIVEMPLWQGQ
ncbi:sensor histidine kinase [Desulfallas thermosapovorans]|uniref:histidine kinase n=1 Tax=Desulfallas thermosapovorans DSM 6562 TaxID=1121431 RepID=A0A5S4ZQN9_9FIRM|nr:HAMP domain-containing sensor histidine kinase [Desulfallas thermosapovorans]TYO93935.1 signal transduction histidine kinase [Desulfallas thermosapovorans DSM 6562]